MRVIGLLIARSLLIFPLSTRFSTISESRDYLRILVYRSSVRRLSLSEYTYVLPRHLCSSVCRNYPRRRLPATPSPFRHIFLTRTNSSLSLFLYLSICLFSPPRHLDNPRLDHPGSPSHHRRPISCLSQQST